MAHSETNLALAQAREAVEARASSNLDRQLTAAWGRLNPQQKKRMLKVMERLLRHQDGA
ncbi:hypothetical protein FBZ84_101141 [Azospirillum baldaniorum]|nr:hypothetical protein FBZ84_101141 [Azospirillum baldaniorum]